MNSSSTGNGEGTAIFIAGIGDEQSDFERRFPNAPAKRCNSTVPSGVINQQLE